MSGEALSTLFLRQGSSPILVEGDLVHASYMFADIPQGFTLEVTFESSTADVRQGIAIEGTGLLVQAADVARKRLALWQDTAPSPARVLLKETRGSGARTLRVWNLWEHNYVKFGFESNNVGMVVEQLTSRSWRLHCSSSVDSVDFSNLVVKLELVPEPTMT